jgi:UDP-N-acetylmuramoyl-tripeptide--D-alanyl-D-alanine ligase
MRIFLDDIRRLFGSPVDRLESVTQGYSVDTRTIQAGDLFIALRGPKHDGHDHVARAFERGAVAAVVDHPVSAKGPQIVVLDTLVALQQLAIQARERWGGEVVAVTGSAGKTTTKDVIADILATKYATGKTIGNFNNHVGVPLSILRLPDECRVAVLELGMNHGGEIRALAKIARPSVGVVTNVGYAHVEFFADSIEGVARAKRELIEELPSSGTAILNADDERVARFREVHPGPAITFGIKNPADVRATDVQHVAGGSRFTCDGVEFETSLAGAHGVLNMLAGLAVAKAFQLPISSLRDAVATFAAGQMRGERSVRNAIVVLNDCYNANPEAMRAMIDVLSAETAARRVAVVGEMLELGQSAEPLHRGVGSYLACRGIDVVIGIRGAARYIVDEAMKAGLSDSAAFFFEDPVEAGELLRRILRAGDAVLFKGSRGVRVEKALEAAFAGEEAAAKGAGGQSTKDDGLSYKGPEAVD